MKNDFETHTVGLASPARASEIITPSDVAELAHATRSIYVGTGGDVTLRMVSGEAVTLTNAQPGAFYPIRVIQVLATGTTASNLLGMR